MLLARLKRWWYLLTRGMWRGECACVIYDERGTLYLGTCRPEDTQFRVWWQRK